MLVFLSTKFNKDQKEKIVNAYYEISPSLPIFIDYQKPITKLLDPRIEDKGILRRQKCIGDDINVILTTDKNREQVINLLTTTIGESFLAESLLSREIAKPEQQGLPTIKIIDNVPTEANITQISSKRQREQSIFLSLDGIEKYTTISTVVIADFRFDELVLQLKNTLTPEVKQVEDLESELVSSEEKLKKETEELLKLRYPVCKQPDVETITIETAPEVIAEEPEEPIGVDPFGNRRGFQHMFNEAMAEEILEIEERQRINGRVQAAPHANVINNFFNMEQQNRLRARYANLRMGA